MQEPSTSSSSAAQVSAGDAEAMRAKVRALDLAGHREWAAGIAQYKNLERLEIGAWEVPATVGELEAWCRGGRTDGVDPSGKFIWKGGEVVFSFGKHQGKPLRQVAGKSPDYLEWILQSDFPADTKALVAEALRGRYPSPPDQST
jgi:hypothetical protein